ncbi:MAG: ferrous iron transport protein A [Synergistaceae bacterium]|jgi:ferrous iron transport protein A|nr:ferrous iron transport protein A [Synergistaceae bacterium]
MSSLISAPLGLVVTIAKIETGDAVKRRLEDLGMLAGQAITPMSDSMGNLVLKVKDSRLVINHGLAKRIYVR